MSTILKSAGHYVAAIALLLSGEVYAQTNLALNKITSASTALLPASAAVDGNSSSRWESNHGIENSWIQVDLGADVNLTSTVIDWEAANPANYVVLGSLDGANWSTLATRTGGTFGNRSDTVTLSGRYHYLRINATQRSAGNNWGYSIWEWKVFGSPASSSTSSKSSLASSSVASSTSSSLKTSSSIASVSSSRASSSSVKSNSSSAASNSSAIATSQLVQAEDFTSYLDLTTGNTGGAYRTTENVDIEATTDSGNGFNVGWTQQGEWLEYKVTLAAGTYNINLRVASNATAGKYSLLIDSNSVGSSVVGNTGGWQVWQTQKLTTVSFSTSGTHTVRLLVDGPDFNLNWIQFEVSSSNSSSSNSSSVNSSSANSSSSTSSDRNRYDAPRAITAPVIDGVMEAAWDAAPWAPIDVYWLGAQHPSAQDFSGRYKAMWNAGNLFLLFDITDDVLFDNWSNPLEHYWDDDSVEIFLDENKNGGNHQFNTSAWAYHVSIFGDVVDFTNSTTAKLLNDHITMRKVSVGSKHLWEMSLRVYGENYNDAGGNAPLTLFAGKQMGFSACYNDNDSSAQRESMIGSVDTQGHKSDQGYINASVFGSMNLVETVPH
jgi:hypothetical protein